MSWSVNATGRAPAVAASIEQQFSGYKCSEPEETVRQQARATIAAALAAQSPDRAVKVAAHGSQSVTGHADGAADTITNNLSITVEPIHGFLE